MRYVVDIDGTICDPGPDRERRYTLATPRKDRIDFINKLYDDGHTIIYLTARGMGQFDNCREIAEKTFYDFTWKQLESWGCKFHDLFLGKPAADLYIDDRGINDHDFFISN